VAMVALLLNASFEPLKVTFYEPASDRDDRFAQLVAKVAVEDPNGFGA
jgi:hypothetical protein